MHPLSPIMSTNLVITFHVIPSKEWFRETLRTINKVYKFIPISDIESYYHSNMRFNNRCHICFDDGDRSVYEHAFPILKEMNLPATLFMSPQIVCENSNYWFQDFHDICSSVNRNQIYKAISEVTGTDVNEINNYAPFSLLKSLQIKNILKVVNKIKKEHNVRSRQYNMTEDELIEISESNIIEIGAHTMNHPILANESDEIAEKEIVDSITGLSGLTGKKVKYFAYPNGIYCLDYTDREMQILKENGIQLAFGDIGFFNKKLNYFSIPRGGFAGEERERKMWIINKIFLMSVWKKIKSKTEIIERMEINRTSLFRAI